MTRVAFPLLLLLLAYTLGTVRGEVCGHERGYEEAMNTTFGGEVFGKATLKEIQEANNIWSE